MDWLRNLLNKEEKPQTMGITASYTRKLNMGIYGGNDFEMKDFFHSISLQVPADEDPKQTMKELRLTCQEVVDNAIEEHIFAVSGGLPKKEWDTWLSDVVGGRGWGDVETYNRMSPFQKNIAQILKRAYKRNK